jgi:hypothetical protein
MGNFLHGGKSANRAPYEAMAFSSSMAPKERSLG